VSQQKMSHDELREIIEYLYGYGGQSKLARTLGVNTRTVQRWISGAVAVPGPVAIAIRGLLDFRSTKI